MRTMRNSKSGPPPHQTYRGYIDNHIAPNIGDIPLEKLNSLELQKRNIHQILSSALKLAQEQRVILGNPTEGCALPKLEHKEMKTLPVE